MTVANDLTTGVLTGSGTQDTVHTGAGTEYEGVLFRNYSGSPVTLKVWLNGVADKDKVIDRSLPAGYKIFMRQRLGNADTVRAEAGAATAISWFLEKLSLT